MRFAQRSAAAMRCCTSRPWPMSTSSWPSRPAQKRSTSAGLRRCSRRLAKRTSPVSRTRAPCGAVGTRAAKRMYNLVRDEAVSIREIADTVRALVSDVPIVHGPERPVDVMIGHVSGERAATELGWQATTPFVEGVRSYVDWLAETSGSPTARAASIIAGNAAAVLAQEPAAL